MTDLFFAVIVLTIAFIAFGKFLSMIAQKQAEMMQSTVDGIVMYHEEVKDNGKTVYLGFEESTHQFLVQRPSIEDLEQWAKVYSQEKGIAIVFNGKVWLPKEQQ